MDDANGTNPIRQYEGRAARWALQTSTIIGASTIVAAAIAGTADAGTGLPVASALIGLVAGGLAAIFLPGHDPAPIVAGLQQIAAAVERNQPAAAATAAVPEAVPPPAATTARATAGSPDVASAKRPVPAT